MNNFIKKHKNLILYGVIGISGAGLDLLFYFIFVKFALLEPSLASFMSVSIGIINNFFLNVLYNFKVNNHLFKRFISFYLTGLSGALISSALIYMLYNVLHISAIVSKLITIIPVVLLQYYINKNLSFKQSNSKKNAK